MLSRWNSRVLLTGSWILDNNWILIKTVFHVLSPLLTCHFFLPDFESVIKGNMKIKHVHSVVLSNCCVFLLKFHTQFHIYETSNGNRTKSYESCPTSHIFCIYVGVLLVKLTWILPCFACFSLKLGKVQAENLTTEKHHHLLAPLALSLTFLSALLREHCQNQAFKTQMSSL